MISKRDRRRRTVKKAVAWAPAGIRSRREFLRLGRIDDRRAEADFRFPAYMPIAHLGATDLDRSDPSLDRAIRPMAMTHDAVTTIR